MGSLLKVALPVLLGSLALIEPAAAEPSGGEVSRLRDARIHESSGLALSAKHDDLVYTINDGGGRPTVFAVQLSTGAVVGVTDVKGLDVDDTESIAVDEEGTLWLGDLGDNDHVRDDISIVAFPEPGPGDHRLASADQHRVALPDGPVDIEAMLVDPDDGRVFLVSKNRNGLGSIFRLPELTPGATASAEDIGADAPRGVSDGAFTHDGRWALLRTGREVWVYNPKTWKPVRRLETPPLSQGESIAVERGDRSVLLGSEGTNSPIVRVSLPNVPADAKPIELDDPSATTKVDRWASIALAVVGLIILGVIGLRRRGVRPR